MPGTTLILYLAGVVPALLLLVAGVSHLAHPTSLADDLRQQGLVPRRAVAATTVALPVVEVALGLAVVAAVHGWTTVPGTAPLAGTAALYAAFACYTVTLLRRRDGRGVPCGCAATGADVTGVVPLRAATLACLALGALMTSPSASAWPAPELLMAGLATATFTVLLWTLPSALAQTGRANTKERGDVVHG